ncbi:MAG: methylcrotonoyl-CoA carboxylase, partial [Hyphomicrobiaceae bacterium]|nr:methylcrotonoyl-CoA carboxylase [Hyphomicrobiaceae bacterium]
MSGFVSTLNASSPEARRNRDDWAPLLADLAEKRALAAVGGSERAREKHLSRGKLLPRERVMQLLDPGTPFLEVAPLAAYGLYGGDIHAAGVIAGVGQVSGRACMIVCNDATIKGGTYYPMTV